MCPGEPEPDRHRGLNGDRDDERDDDEVGEGRSNRHSAPRGRRGPPRAAFPASRAPPRRATRTAGGSSTPRRPPADSC